MNIKPQQLLRWIITQDISAVLQIIQGWGRRPSGLYAVLEFKSHLELLDDAGRKTMHAKIQRVRFLQDNIIAYQDQVWGDGDIFADYQCSPDKAVDRYKDGNRYRVLISLRETKNRDDIQDIYINREVHNGYIKSVEYFQNKVSHPTRKMQLIITFPKNRPLRRAVLLQENAGESEAIDGEQLQTLPDGRQRIVCIINKPKLYETYSIKWRW